MGEQRIPKKILHTKNGGKRPSGRVRTRGMHQSRKDTEMWRENWEEKKSEKIETAGDFCNCGHKSLETNDDDIEVP